MEFTSKCLCRSEWKKKWMSCCWRTCAKPLWPPSVSSSWPSWFPWNQQHQHYTPNSQLLHREINVKKLIVLAIVHFSEDPPSFWWPEASAILLFHCPLFCLFSFQESIGFFAKLNKIKPLVYKLINRENIAKCLSASLILFLTFSAFSLKFR